MSVSSIRRILGSEEWFILDLPGRYRNVRRIIPRVNKVTRPVCLLRMGMYIIMTLPAKAHQVRHAEGGVFIFRAAHFLRAPVMDIGRRLAAPQAFPLVPEQGFLPGLAPVHQFRCARKDLTIPAATTNSSSVTSGSARSRSSHFCSSPTFTGS